MNQSQLSVSRRNKLSVNLTKIKQHTASVARMKQEKEVWIQSLLTSMGCGHVPLQHVMMPRTQFLLYHLSGTDAGLSLMKSTHRDDATRETDSLWLLASCLSRAGCMSLSSIARPHGDRLNIKITGAHSAHWAWHESKRGLRLIPKTNILNILAQEQTSWIEQHQFSVERGI